MLAFSKCKYLNRHSVTYLKLIMPLIQTEYIIQAKKAINISKNSR